MVLETSWLANDRHIYRVPKRWPCANLRYMTHKKWMPLNIHFPICMSSMEYVQPSGLVNLGSLTIALKAPPAQQWHATDHRYPHLNFIIIIVLALYILGGWTKFSISLIFRDKVHQLGSIAHLFEDMMPSLHFNITFGLDKSLWYDGRCSLEVWVQVILPVKYIIYRLPSG